MKTAISKKGISVEANETSANPRTVSGARFGLGCLIGFGVMIVWLGFNAELDVQHPWTYACIGMFSLIAGVAYDWYRNALEAVSFSAGIILVTFFAYSIQLGLNRGWKHMAVGLIVLHLGGLIRRLLTKKSL